MIASIALVKERHLGGNGVGLLILSYLICSGSSTNTVHSSSKELAWNLWKSPSKTHELSFLGQSLRLCLFWSSTCRILELWIYSLSFPFGPFSYFSPLLFHDMLCNLLAPLSVAILSPPPPSESLRRLPYFLRLRAFHVSFYLFLLGQTPRRCGQVYMPLKGSVYCQEGRGIVPPIRNKLLCHSHCGADCKAFQLLSSSPYFFSMQAFHLSISLSPPD